LVGRGISAESADRFGLGLAIGGFDVVLKAAESAKINRRLLIDAGVCKVGTNGSVYDTFRDRLMFPIRDSSGRHIAFGGRTLVNDDAKYLNTPETVLFCKRKSLYGLDLARETIVATRTAIIVEGYTDCIACHQHGFTNAVATLGTSVTDDHMTALRRYCDTVILVLDADVAGAAAAERALGIGLKHGLTVRLASTNGAKDPCDFLQASGAKEFTSLLNSAKDALVFQWQRTRERYAGGETQAIKRRVTTDFVSLVTELSQFGAIDAIQQGIIVGQLANLLELPAERVRGLLYDRAQHVRRQAVETVSRRLDRPRSAEQAALVEILRLVIAQPEYYAQLGEEFDADRIEEPAYRRIAEHMRAVATKRGGFVLADLLARLTDTNEADLLTDLATEGSRLDPAAIDAAFASAVARLRESAENRETQRLTALCRQTATGEPVADDSDMRERLALVGRRLAGRRGFSHARAINEFGRAE
jgi:DNA primase